MKPQRKQRLKIVVFLFLGTAATVGFLLLALQDNVNLFYPPGQVVSGEAPVDTRIRAGGMVAEGTVMRGEELETRFRLSDLAGADFEVRYTGILPDLFREGQGVVATGQLGADGVFRAEQILAKHDEKYMPPELAGMAQSAAPDGSNNPGAAESGAALAPPTAGPKEKLPLPASNWGSDT